MTIKAVFFDLDDTLLWDDRSIDEAFVETSKVAAERYNLDSTAFENAIKHEARQLYSSFETFPFTQMIGINPFEGLWGNFTSGEQAEFRVMQKLAPYYRSESWTRALRAFGIEDVTFGTELGERFAFERRARPYVYDETFEILKTLQEKNFKLLLLTNGSPDLQQEKIDSIKGLAECFHHIVISGQFGEGKPAISIFQHSLDLLNLSKDEAIMVGDKLTTDILGSSRLGMKNVWINRKQMIAGGDIVPTYEINDLMQLLSILE